MNAYLASIYAGRLRHLALFVDQQKALDKLFFDTHKDISRILDTYQVDDVIQYRKLRALQREIEKELGLMFTTYQDYLVEDITKAVNVTVQSKMKAGMVYLYDRYPKEAESVPKMFATVPRLALQAIFTRRLDDGLVFSDRIWNLQTYTVKNILDTVADAVVRGKSVYNLSLSLEKFLLGKVSPEEYEAIDIFSPAYKKALSKRANVRYNAYRLAKTELAHAYTEASVQSAKMAPWVRGVRWNLSASHPKFDICDVWATQDLYGLGKGVYPPDSTPVDHPNGLCFVTDELLPVDLIADAIQRRMRNA